MSVSGKIKVMFPIQQIGANGFTKREFVIETDETYPQFLKLELVKDNCAMLDKFKIDDNVNIEFNLKGREWNGKYFVNLEAWRITKLQIEGAPVESQASTVKNPQTNVPNADVDNGDLPF
jgi:single-strand DNA-binding protein